MSLIINCVFVYILTGVVLAYIFSMDGDQAREAENQDIPMSFVAIMITFFWPMIIWTWKNKGQAK